MVRIPSFTQSPTATRDDGGGRVDKDRTATGRHGLADPSATSPVAAGPRPRASMLATAGLILGVIAAGMVFTGTLAGYGLGVGVVGLLASLGGFSATKSRHVAGKSDAMLGICLSLGAVIVGALVLTGSMAWSTDSDQVTRLRDWLDANIADRF